MSSIVSLPPMRERRCFRAILCIFVGITPAYAGKTVMEFSGDFLDEDHPRVCGKDILLKLTASKRQGSPPRMRERLIFARLVYFFQRITPAYAGKTNWYDKKTFLLQDHPRVCGKDGTMLVFNIPCQGSPPRMRERHSQIAW